MPEIPHELLYVLFIIAIALAFDFINGFHDAANSIATVVSTRVLTPLQAVFWAALWNFVAAWFFGLHIAKTIGKGVIPPHVVTADVILAGLLGAIIWDLITWAVALPTSSSHALVGGFAGAACAASGKWVVISSGIQKIGLFIVLSPVIGFILGHLFLIITTWLLRKKTPTQVDRLSRITQLLTSAAYSIGHGTNDAQKTMGIIAVLLYTTLWKNGLAAFQGGADFPFWIVIICHAAMGLGTMAGGWRIVKTMGMRITKLKPHGGACAESAAAITLFTTASLGIPVSTTHTITGAIVGVGSARRFSAVRWGVTARVVWAWILTIPCAGTIGALSLFLINILGGWVACLALGIATWLFVKWWDARKPEEKSPVSKHELCSEGIA